MLSFSYMNRGVIYTIILFLLISLATATTFIPQDLDDLDNLADYVLIGTVLDQKSSTENNGRSISTQTSIDVEEWLKGSSSVKTVVVKELGGIVGDVVMVVPGSPQFEVGEHVALFLDETDGPYQSGLRRWVRNTPMYGHVVGMAQGKFSIQKNENGDDILINDLSGAHLLTEPKKNDLLTLGAFRSKYKQDNKQGIFARFITWLEGLW